MLGLPARSQKVRVAQRGFRPRGSDPPATQLSHLLAVFWLHQENENQAELAWVPPSVHCTPVPSAPAQ